MMVRSSLKKIENVLVNWAFVGGIQLQNKKKQIDIYNSSPFLISYRSTEQWETALESWQLNTLETASSNQKAAKEIVERKTACGCRNQSTLI